MTGIASVATAALAVVLALLAAALWRERLRRAGLQRQLDAAADELQRLQTACARLAPAGVVNRLVADGLHAGAELPAERKVVTALFSDLVGYTAMSERIEPAELARIVNGYFQRMSDAIHENGGHVSTFLGDGILVTSARCVPTPGNALTLCAPRWRCARRCASTTPSSGARASARWHWVSAFTAGQVLPAWLGRVNAWSTASSAALSTSPRGCRRSRAATVSTS
jgi:class 3 adenylate cyclase